MAAVTKKDVENAAVLSRFRLSESEAKETELYFSNVLGHIEGHFKEFAAEFPDMKGAGGGRQDFSDAVPFAMLRKDVIEPPTPNETLMRTAPDSSDGAYAVPAVME